MERGRIQGLSNFCVPPIISGTGKATDFKFGEYIYRANPSGKYLELDGQGRARREAARRRKSEWKVNLGIQNSSRSNGSW